MFSRLASCVSPLPRRYPCVPIPALPRRVRFAFHPCSYAKRTFSRLASRLSPFVNLTMALSPLASRLLLLISCFSPFVFLCLLWLTGLSLRLMRQGELVLGNPLASHLWTGWQGGD